LRCLEAITQGFPSIKTVCLVGIPGMSLVKFSGSCRSGQTMLQQSSKNYRKKNQNVEDEIQTSKKQANHFSSWMVLSHVH
jgi:hypothetical protein